MAIQGVKGWWGGVRDVGDNGELVGGGGMILSRGF